MRDKESREYVPPAPQHHDDLYYVPPPVRIPAGNKLWQSRLKFDLPEFEGIYATDAVLDWLQAIEHILKSSSVPNEKCVNVVVSHFRDAAAAWWRSLCTQFEQVGAPLLLAWLDSCYELKKPFLLYKYKQQLFYRLCSFWQGPQSIQEYTQDFHNLTSRNELAETDDQLVAWYMTGLRPMR